MRLHIVLPDDLIEDLDKVAGTRGRSAFIRNVVEKAVDEERRWQYFEQAFGAIKGIPHEWDEDPAAWVRAHRRGMDFQEYLEMEKKKKGKKNKRG